MIPRQTQTAHYWDDSFGIEDADLEHLYNLLLEDETPLTSDELVRALIRRRVEQEKRALERQLYRGSTAYTPKDKYTVGQELTFPQLQFANGKVVAVRPGNNPAHGDFDVITVEFDGAPARHFAARLPDHKLNTSNGALEEGGTPLLSADDLAAEYGRRVRPKLEARLKAKDDIVRIAGRWFPKPLLADINEGHLNLAEAVLDMAGGGPLPTHELLPHLDLPKTINEKLTIFSLDYAMQEDPRFDEVGPAGKVLWYLHRVEPPEVKETPSWLVFNQQPVPVELPAELHQMDIDLHDEFGSELPRLEPVEEVTLSLTFPHLRAGTLPLSQTLAKLFPTAYESPRIRFTLVDGHTGDKLPGWVVRQGRYVFGLRKWYEKYEMIAGGWVTIRSGQAPGEVIIEIARRRPAREWVRAASVSSNRVTFSMQKQAVAVEYDEQMVVAVDAPAELDSLWQRTEYRQAPLAQIVVDTFRELAKLTPQSAVNARSLYSAVNVVRRVPPAHIFAELVARPYFSHVGDAYWRFDESKYNE